MPNPGGWMELLIGIAGLVSTIADCLLEAMDFPGLKRVLEGMEAGRFRLVARRISPPHSSKIAPPLV